MSFINALTENQIAGIRLAAVENGISVSNFDWFIDGFQSSFSDGTNAVYVLGELLELQAQRLDEGQTPLNPGGIKKLLVMAKGNTPLLAGSLNKKGELSRSELNPLFEPLVVGTVRDTDIKKLVSGGHRSATIATLTEIIVGSDSDALPLYLDETKVRVIEREYATTEQLAKAILAANGSRTPTMKEKEDVFALTRYGINVNNYDELREQVTAGKLSVKDWGWKMAEEGRAFINKATDKPLADLTKKKLIGKVYQLLIDESYDVLVGNANGEATTESAGSYKLVKDLILSNRYKYSLNDDLYEIWSAYDEDGDKWQFSDTKKHWEWVIPSHMTTIFSIIGEETVGVLATTTISEIARQDAIIAEEIANRVLDRIDANKELSAHALPPKPPVKSAKKVQARRTSK
ncbi:hypothetical protein [Arthronema virus TR020]|uniref:Uncharacterized protein n=1 Tax=Arthronema virus TR020 TaxID=2736280 RepID=A0A7G3WH13_9CAUD|nr:hypothetical protein [Arthronema virus TR020]